MWVVLLVWGTLVVGGGFDARRRLADLKPWHTVIPEAEVRASDIGDGFTLADYLRREAEVFREVAERVEAAVPAEDRSTANRYVATSRSHPTRAGRDWNRTFELTPDTLRGGALLVHGLTDSPYSMRALAETLQQRGYYALSLRMPGHGTVPAALTRATWEDWMAAVRLGVRHVRERVGADRPVVLVGYSNGGALVTKYALDALEGGDGWMPSRLVLVSPMIGVTPAAVLARTVSRLGPIPFFAKAKWTDVVPEYNPFKYNSFTANAGFQTHRLTTVIRSQVLKAAEHGRIARLPPILAFQSIVDGTVSTAAVVHDLFDHLADNGSELVLFDINRVSGLEPFIRPAEAALRSRLIAREPRPYRRTLVTNVASDTADVAAMSAGPGSLEVTGEPLGLAWPQGVFSLSHVAVPFRTDDPLYGLDAPPDPAGVVQLGRLSPRGERAVLTVPVDTLMRISSNPFFPYLASRVQAWAP